MAHGLENCVSVLRRWASVSDGPLPSDWASFRAVAPTEAMHIEMRDPELVGLLSGKASAGLRADALVGKLAAVAPTLESQQQAAIAEQVRQLTESNPYGQAGYQKPDGSHVEPVGGNLTNALRLEQIAPDVAAKMRKESGMGEVRIGPSREEQERIDAEVMQLRTASLESMRKRALAQGGGH